MKKIIWFDVQTVSNKWNILIETPRNWSWKDVGFEITNPQIIKRLEKFANFADFKGIIEKEFKTKLEELIKFERGCKVDNDDVRIILVDLKTGIETNVKSISDANKLALEK